MFPSSTTSNDSAIISSSSGSSSSSSSPFSHLPNNNNNSNNNLKIMEEVWKEINIPSLPNTPLPHHNHYTNQPNLTYTTINTNIIKNINNIIHHPTPSTNFRGIILQDFLNCNNPSITPVDLHHHDHNQGSDIHRQQTPVTTLKLTNEFQQQVFDPQNYSAFATFETLGSSAVLVTDGGGCRGGGKVVKKRSSESKPGNVDVDRKHKRMIKNRESAARSRARKQAYTTELELEVAHLAAENLRLRKQQQQLLEGVAPPSQPPQKHRLIRTLSAPI